MTSLDDRDAERFAPRRGRHYQRRALTGGAAETVPNSKSPSRRSARAPRVSIRFFSRHKKMKAADQAGGRSADRRQHAQRCKAALRLPQARPRVVLTAENGPNLAFMHARVIEKPPQPPVNFDHQIVTPCTWPALDRRFRHSITQVALVATPRMTVQQTTQQPCQMSPRR
jgi:hypothetical protein